jgi:uncharacterized OB-fold protein
MTTASATTRVPADADLFELLEPDRSGGRARLLASYSEAAETHYWPRRRRCPLTATPVEQITLDASGTLWAWSYVNFPWRGVSAPSPIDGYACGLIDLPEGPRVLGVLIGTQQDWTIGDAMVGVALDFIEKDGETTCLLAFKREESA